MKLKISNKTIIYIIVPANIRPGGPKDLHQLANILQKKHKNKIYIYYYTIPGFKVEKNPVHSEYRKLKIPFTKKIYDEKKNILIFPELNHTIEISKKYKKIQKVLWWMSLDNFLISRFSEKNHRIIKSFIKLPFKIISIINNLTFYFFGNLNFFKYLKFIYLYNPFINILKIENIRLNLSQAEYVKINLLKKNIKSEHFSGFLKKVFINEGRKLSIKNKKNIVCYNPRKSSKFMEAIIKYNPDIKFVALKNYSIKNVVKILKSSKLYMDFGYHPGQDHMPREAVILKNCIITNKEGSALFYKDVPIEQSFKYRECYTNLNRIRKKIKLIFENYPREIKKFKKFEKLVSNQETIFRKKVHKIFK